MANDGLISNLIFEKRGGDTPVIKLEERRVWPREVTTDHNQHSAVGTVGLVLALTADEYRRAGGAEYSQHHSTVAVIVSHAAEVVVR